MSEQEHLEIRINGKSREFSHAMTILDLLVQLDLPTESGIAVERNQLIVSKSDYAGTWLQSGDVLEIVTLVGGG